MNLEFAFREENGVVILKVSSPDKPLVIETTANEPGTPVTATPIQKENVSPVTETVTAEDKVKADISVLSEKLDSMTRQYERVKKAAWRAGKRLENYLKASGQTVPATGNYCPQSATAGSPQSATAGSPQPAVNHCPSSVPTHVPSVPKCVPGDSWGQGQVVTTYSNTNTNDYNHVIDKDNNHGFIPFANLPEMFQKILTAWNNLPLPEKLKGLYPDVAQKLHKLLKEYGEAAVQKAIHMVTESPFLLGKITNTRGWRHIYFGWLLNPANLKKILENKYRNREQSYDGVTYPEYIPWDNVEGHYLDPEYMLKGMDPLTDQARSSLAHAAKLLGLTKIQAA